MQYKFDETYLSCPICHSNTIREYHVDFRDNHIYKCASCSVQFMNPVYSDKYLAEYYAGYIGLDYNQRTLDEQHEVCKQNFRAINQFMPNKGEMLDFGIGNGAYANYARDLGWKVTGYDVDCSTTQALADKLSMEVRCGDFEELDWGGRKFDLIYAHHVVEHLKDPVTRLKGFHEILNDDGYLYIGVPNISSLGSRVKFFLEKAGLKKKRVGKYYDSEHHIFYFTPDSLGRVLQLSGFEVVFRCNASKPKPYQNRVLKFIRQNVKEKLTAGAAFFVIARKNMRSERQH